MLCLRKILTWVYGTATAALLWQFLLLFKPVAIITISGSNSFFCSWFIERVTGNTVSTSLGHCRTRVFRQPRFFMTFWKLIMTIITEHGSLGEIGNPITGGWSYRCRFAGRLMAFNTAFGTFSSADTMSNSPVTCIV